MVGPKNIHIQRTLNGLSRLYLYICTCVHVCIIITAKERGHEFEKQVWEVWMGPVKREERDEVK